MAQLSDLTVKLVVDNSSFNQALSSSATQAEQSSKQMEMAFDGAREALSALGIAFSVGAVVEYGEGVVSTASHIHDLAAETGFSVASLVNMKAALKANGGDLDTFSQAVNLLSANLGAAGNGSLDVIKKFDQLGLSVTKLKQMGLENAFYAVTQALSGLDAETEMQVGKDLLGRNFAKLKTTIDAANGALGEHIQALNALNGKEMTDNIEAVNKAHEAWASFTDELENKTIIILGNAVTALSALRTEMDKQRDTPLEGYAQAKLGAFQTQGSAATGTTAPADIIGLPHSLQGVVSKLVSNSAAGNNDDVKKADTTIQDYIQHLQDEIKVVNAAKDEQAGYTALYDLTEQAQKKNITLTDQEAKTVFNLANAYEAAKKARQEDKTITDYIQNLQNENDALNQQQDAQEGVADYYKLVNKLMGEGLTLQEAELKIGDENKDQIIALGDAHADLTKQQEDAKKSAEEWQHSLSDGLTNLALNFKSASDAASGFFNTIAQAIIKQSISDPLSKAIAGLVPNPSSLFSSLFSGGSSGGLTTSDIGSSAGMLDISGPRAGGGGVNSGNSYLVGENGPEIFTPDVSGGITPNNRVGGGSNVNFTQIIQVSPGVPELIDAKIRQSAPIIASQAQAGVFNAIRNGGSAAKLIGLRA